MAILFRDAFLDKEEFDRAVRINTACALISPVKLEAWVISDERCAQAEFLGDALEQLKLCGRLVHGEDTRASIAVTPDERYVRWATDIPQHPITVARHHGGPVVAPVDYPDPAGEFYGYDRWTVRGVDGAAQPGTKHLVATVGRIAAALLALGPACTPGASATASSGIAPTSTTNGPNWWGRSTRYCRNWWGYLIPADAADRRRLRALCQRALAFENHFLAVYKPYLLAELRGGQREDIRAHVLERLGQIIYPEPACSHRVGAVRAVRRRGSPETRHGRRIGEPRRLWPGPRPHEAALRRRNLVRPRPAGVVSCDTDQRQAADR